MIWLCRSDPINFSMPYGQIANLKLTLCCTVGEVHPRVKQRLMVIGQIRDLMLIQQNIYYRISNRYGVAELICTVT